MGMEKISFEQVMLYNPDVILVMENVFYKEVFSDPRWQRIKAVKNKKVYLIPNQPFNWFDRPHPLCVFLVLNGSQAFFIQRSTMLIW